MTDSEHPLVAKVRGELERRRTPKAKGQGLRRTAKLCPRSKDKAKREAKRAEQFGPQSRMCRMAVCAVPGCRAMPPQDPHHIESRNRAGKDDTTVPLCKTNVARGYEGHHQELHRIGQRSFEAKHRVILEVVAGRLAEAVATHACEDWAVQDIQTGEVSCGVCEKPCDAPVSS